MPPYSETITEFWRAQFLGGDVRYSSSDFVLATNPDLRDDRRAMVLETADGRVIAVLTPPLADRLGLMPGAELTAALFRRRLRESGVALHGADQLFYFAEAERSALQREAPTGGVRRLTERDAEVFADFCSTASEQDVDDAYVELDHWAVFGSFEQGGLVSAASAYPWDGACIADLGVLTGAPFRGRGHARNVVRSISRHAYEQGYEPQYRCQLDNQASAALARSAGLTLFGTWEVITPG